MQQKTLQKHCTLNGIALHSGKESRITFKPAPENHGIIFVRTDLEEKIRVPALAEWVDSTQRGTSLKKDQVKICVIEHVLSALAGLGIDNVEIELDSEEPPALDGSAQKYVGALKKTGIKEQSVPKQILELDSPIIIESKDKLLIAVPHHGLKVSFMLDFPVIGAQFYSFEAGENDYIKEIAPSRTFGFLEEVDELKKQQLAQGAALENALVISQEKKGYVNAPRFENEPVRHKILDLLGDLALCGFGIQAHIIAIKSGHALNVELAKKIRTLGVKT